MSAAVLLLSRPRGMDDSARSTFRRVSDAFPARLRAMTSTERSTPTELVRVWWHPRSRTSGFADDPKSGSWLAVVGNPTRMDLVDAQGESVLSTLLTEILHEGPQILETVSAP